MVKPKARKILPIPKALTCWCSNQKAKTWGKGLIPKFAFGFFFPSEGARSGQYTWDQDCWTCGELYNASIVGIALHYFFYQPSFDQLLFLYFWVHQALCVFEKTRTKTVFKCWVPPPVTTVKVIRVVLLRIVVRCKERNCPPRAWHSYDIVY